MPKQNITPAIQFRHEEILPYAAVAQRFTTLRTSNPNVDKLLTHASALGYAPATTQKDLFGIRHTVQAATPVRDPASGATVSAVTFEFHFQNLVNPKSKTAYAIGVATISAGAFSESYELLLEAPNGSIRNSREWTIKGGQVVRAHSWWSKMSRCLTGRCAGVCAAALAACSGTWVAYLGCVIVACGGCWVVCGACASCSCSWWCRWAVGCCR
jgi:hypothetical protein